MSPQLFKLGTNELGTSGKKLKRLNGKGAFRRKTSVTHLFGTDIGSGRFERMRLTLADNSITCEERLIEEIKLARTVREKKLDKLRVELSVAADPRKSGISIQ